MYITIRAYNPVAGKPKPFDEVTTDDEAYLMSAEEREVSLVIIIEHEVDMQAYETLMMSM